MGLYNIAVFELACAHKHLIALRLILLSILMTLGGWQRKMTKVCKSLKSEASDSIYKTFWCSPNTLSGLLQG